MLATTHVGDFLTFIYLRLILQDVLSKKPGLAGVFDEFLGPEVDDTCMGHIMWDINYGELIQENVGEFIYEPQISY